MSNSARRRRSSAGSVLLAAVCAAAAVCLVIGTVRLVANFDGFVEDGYSTSTVGAPAYAAIFMVSAPHPWWFVSGTLVLLLGAAWVAWALARRGAATRFARTAAGTLLVGLLLLVIGVAALPRHVPRFGDEPKDAPDIPLHVPGRVWLDVGTALAFVASAGLMRRALTPRGPAA